VTVGAVVLAAGGGSRFLSADGAHKLLAPFRGRPLVTWSVASAVASGVGPVAVVVGAVPLGDVVSGLGDDVRVLRNRAWHLGQATSLGVAISYATGAGWDAVVIGLGDQPLLAPSAWAAVAAAPDEPPIAVATYDGRRGNPVRLGSAVWPLLSFSGDEGARELMRRRPELVGAVACEGSPADVDTVEDLEQWS
jgi:CTP:molybdopterin cytidylyltransferase MocA